MMDPNAAAPEGAPEQGGEDQIVDQIGQLLSQLPQQKQQELLAMLTQQLSGDSQMGVASEHGGPNGVPVPEGI